MAIAFGSPVFGKTLLNFSSTFEAGNFFFLQLAPQIDRSTGQPARPGQILEGRGRRREASFPICCPIDSARLSRK